MDQFDFIDDNELDRFPNTSKKIHREARQCQMTKTTHDAKSGAVHIGNVITQQC